MIWKDVATTERLLSQAVRGNCQATVELFNSELGAMYDAACLLLGGADDALEMVRQAVTVAVDNLGELKDASLFSSWARTFVVSRTLEYMVGRRTSILNGDSTEYEPLTIDQWGDWDSDEILELFLSAVRPNEPDSHHPVPDSFRLILQRLLQSLPDNLRTSFVLHDVFSFRVDETCSFLVLPPEEVRSLLAAARHKLVIGVLNELRSMAAAMRCSDDTPTSAGNALDHVHIKVCESDESFSSFS